VQSHGPAWPAWDFGEDNVIQTNQPCDARIREMLIRMARSCRDIIQPVREEDFSDREFYLIFREELENLQKRDKGGSVRE
jgi:hypothetical protein